jgi:type IX secretion system PorP/SprF family membrane protein
LRINLKYSNSKFIKLLASSLKLPANILLLLTSYFMLLTSCAQDIHFTQFNNSPLTLNPANTGQFHGDDRFSLIDRNQWSSVTKPFQTFSASYDTRLLTRSFHKDMIGIGVVFYRDKAGDSDFGTTQASLSLSYSKSIDKLKRHFLTFALQGGMAQRTIDYSKLMFDNQFNGSVYDPGISSNEQFSKSNFLYPDISAGISWSFFINSSTNISSGISLFHINQPDQSVIQNGLSKLDSRFSGYLNMESAVTDKLSLAPAVLFMQQGTYQEADFGVFLKFIKDKSLINYTGFNIGAFTRVFDAVNVIASMDYRKFTVGLSYDINYSALEKASHARGGYEISVVYRIFRQNHPLNKPLPCSIF